MTYKGIPVLFLILALLICSCKNKNKLANNTSDTTTSTAITLQSPAFDADSAFKFVKTQVDFGPRIPGTKAHTLCAIWLQNKLQGFGAKVNVQSAPIKTYDGKQYQLKNIIASYQPEKKDRILITAHWDARPFSNEDTDPKMKDKPFEAANDGGSGVGVILEMARQLQQKNPNVGVDFILWDLEDYGKSQDDTPDERTWCLGSQYWASHPHVPNYQASYGINLDMVGGNNAQFLREGHSRENAPDILKKVWDTGNTIGYSSYFIYRNCSEIVDDHFWMNKAGVPSIDIVHFSDEAGFYINWHTQQDNLSNINPQTLKAVGQTLLEVLFLEEGAGK
ncbi:MAG: M28 family peptidase [Sphingobacteriaceae bacterium]